MPTQDYIIAKPNTYDVEGIHSLITHYAQTSQELLPRNSDHISKHLRDFWIAYTNEPERKIVACASLFIWANYLSEIKSLAVHQDCQGKGIGKELVMKCLEDAREIGQREVFALTFKPEFFFKLGFKLTERNNLPHKVWNECIHCPKLHNCGEIAVSYVI